MARSGKNKSQPLPKARHEDPKTYTAVAVCGECGKYFTVNSTLSAAAATSAARSKASICESNH